MDARLFNAYMDICIRFGIEPSIEQLKQIKEASKKQNETVWS